MNITINAILGGASVLTVLAAFVWLILTGRLVPASQLDSVRDDRDKAVARAESETQRWRLAYEFSEKARSVEASHVSELIQVGRVTTQVLTALPGTTTPGSSEDPNVATPA